MSLYFDHAAATPLDERALAAMRPYFSQQFYNPSALYGAARQSHRELEQWRARAAAVLGARPPEIIFTAGGSESDNLAVDGVMRQYPDATVITSTIEHEAVLAPAGQYRHRVLPVDDSGLVNPGRLVGMIDDSVALVSIMYANNEIGTIEPLRKIAQELQNIRRQRHQAGNRLPLLFHSDSCQAAEYLDLHVNRLGIDLLTLNGGKMYGPKQSGLLYVKGGSRLTPLVRGGGQERGLRSGTENLAAIAGFVTALEIAQAGRQTEVRRLQALQRQFMDELRQKLPQAVINGSLKQRLPNNVHLTIPGADNERLLIGLDEAGIQAAAGSACSASNDTPSHVLRAIGLSDEAAHGSLRFSMGRQTASQDVTTVVETLARLV